MKIRRNRHYRNRGQEPSQVGIPADAFAFGEAFLDMKGAAVVTDEASDRCIAPVFARANRFLLAAPILSRKGKEGAFLREKRL